MTFRLQLREEDYLRAAKFCGQRWLLRFALPYFLVLSILMYWITRNSAGYGTPFQIGFMAFLLLILSFKWFVQMPARTRKLYRQQHEVHDELTYIFEEEHLGIEHKNGSVKKPWKEFLRWKKGEDLILIFLTDRSYFLIPKIHLSDEEWEIASAMIERKLGAG